MSTYPTCVCGEIPLWRNTPVITLTIVLLNPDIPCLYKQLDPDQLASEEAN